MSAPVNDDVHDAAWILIHQVDDHRGTDLPALVEAARLLVAVADRAARPARDERPHSRACGWRNHEHGTACHPNCPTCHGRAEP